MAAAGLRVCDAAPGLEPVAGPAAGSARITPPKASTISPYTPAGLVEPHTACITRVPGTNPR
ncbi:hypothetical protein ACFQZK_32355 [Rhodococcus aetherivorans]